MTAPQGHPAYGTSYDAAGNFVFRGGAKLTPQGRYIDPEGVQRHGPGPHRIRQSDGALCNAIPTPDGADPRPLPPLVPTSLGWPTPPANKGWPRLSNPNWND